MQITQAYERPSKTLCTLGSTLDAERGQRSKPKHTLRRGFLLWRLSDAGRRTRGAVPQAAGIRNPSQFRTHALRQSIYSIASSTWREMLRIGYPD